MAIELGRRRLQRCMAAGGLPPTVAVVGGGLSGLAMAAQLHRSGITGVTVFERSDGVGGTWRDNTYPGAGCDVPSHLYSFSFARKADWTRRYADQPEILAYAESLVDRFDLRAALRLSTAVTGADYDEILRRWRVSFTGPDGDGVLEADVLVLACGQLNRPAVPDLDGLDRFAGPSWHSARWDHTVDLAGRRVGVVGSGASAIQFVPRVASEAAAVTIFQRTPNYVAPKRDRAYRGVERRLLERVRPYEVLYRWCIYWGLELRWPVFRRPGLAGRLLGRTFRRKLRAGMVSERLPEAAVVPDYPVGCKRILISNEWYPALLRPTVDVVTAPIDHVEADAVVTADGERHPVDALVFGTGFETTSFLSHLPVRGVGGRTLAAAWHDGARAHLGITVPGFPDCFLLYGPNTNLGHNSILFMVERQVNWILQALAMRSEAAAAVGGAGVAAVDVRRDVAGRSDRWTQRLASRTTWASTCTSWYKTAAGRVTNNWPSWTVRYWLDTLVLRRRDLEVDAVLPDRPAGDAAGRRATAG
ncbi:MAG: NAD(P)/FAD-dependent oxidoreductase [Actinomycetota bacterium]|jgi:cation diffusion facilitator CzcD-associated flavoprotein CzcO|nr:NAD(P)/FAD-dependent oxidoreductase [Actinomycetota bacterium]